MCCDCSYPYSFILYNKILQMPPRSRRPFRLARKEQHSCSPLTIAALFLLTIWVVFVVYCWRVGLIGYSNKPFDPHLLGGDKDDGKVIENGESKENEGVGLSISALDLQIPPKKEKSMFSKEYLNKVAASDIHVIFSTDCNPYQDWQSLFVFHSAYTVGQPGPITRIASGCNEEQQKKLKDLYGKLWPQYRVHFTPDFKKDPKTGKKYDFYNKPYGLKHFLANAEPPLPKNVIIALIDPDQMFLRTITPEIKGNPNNIISGKWKQEEIFDRVVKGKPVGQTYGLGAPWTNDNHKKFNRKNICGEGSPCLDVPNEAEGNKYYSLGPPYIFHREDGERIAESWTNFVPRVYEGYPYLLAEMYAYSMAAAHEKLPHLRMDQYMVSNTECSGEGWDWVDALDDVCEPPDENGIFYPGKPMPTVVHYCQFFIAGEMAFGKRRVPHDIFTCESPLLLEPSSALAEAGYKLGKKNGKISTEVHEVQSRIQAKRHAFMICQTHRGLNAAAIDYKKRMCGPDANFEKSINLVKLQ